MEAQQIEAIRRDILSNVFKECQFDSVKVIHSLSYQLVHAINNNKTVDVQAEYANKEVK